MTWIGIALVPALTFFLFRTRGGLRLRVRRREAARRGHRRRVGGADPVRRRRRLRHVRGARRGLPLGRLRRVVQQQHDERSRLHRAGGDDLRQVEAVGRPVGVLLFGFGSAMSDRVSGVNPTLGTLFEALPYVLTLVAVAGLVGPLAAAGGGRNPVREGVAMAPDRTTWRPLTVARSPDQFRRRGGPPQRRGGALPAHVHDAAALERRDAAARARALAHGDGLEPAPARRQRGARPRRVPVRGPAPARMASPAPSSWSWARTSRS